ncbi:serine/threonine protein kinase [Bradyrhizobium sp. JR1.5]|uniref:protein kinase n=1 Tax=unclassified Bradyrhizobium TaxID=2631580 RepID=UPI00339A383A
MKKDWMKFFRLEDGRLFKEGTLLSFPDHEFLGVLGMGASGVVFKAKNKWLDREEALKIWLRIKPSDDRDKIIQGTFEAQKLAEAEIPTVLPVYAAGVANGNFYSTMQVIRGPSLRTILRDQRTDADTRLMLAQKYAKALNELADAGLVHGDPHAGNVLLRFPAPNLTYHYSDGYFLEGVGPIGVATPVFCDFGTSRYMGKGGILLRNRRVSIETLFDIFDDPEIKELDAAKKALRALSEYRVKQDPQYPMEARLAQDSMLSDVQRVSKQQALWHPNKPLSEVTQSMLDDRMFTQFCVYAAHKVRKAWQTKNRPTSD